MALRRDLLILEKGRPTVATHISPKEGEIWGTLQLLLGTEGFLLGRREPYRDGGTFAGTEGLLPFASNAQASAGSVCSSRLASLYFSVWCWLLDMVDHEGVDWGLYGL